MTKMKKFYVLQPRLSAEESARVNALGWNGTPEGRTYLAMTMGDPAPAAVCLALDAGRFALGWTVTSDHVEDVFSLANYMPGRGTAERHEGATSMSVGDLLVWATDDGEYDCARCASFGFDALSPMIARRAARVANIMEGV